MADLRIRRHASRPAGMMDVMRLPAGLRALRHRDFRLFWWAQLISLTGTWMQSVAQAWLVLELTRSPFRLGLLGTLQFGPFLLLSFFTGAIADRVPKRRVVVMTQSVLAFQALALSVLAATGHIQYWHVALLAVLAGTVNTLDMPTRQSFIADMVGAADLGNAIALNSAVFSAARIVGPAVAGLLIARWGVRVAFLLNAVSFVPVIAALLAVRTEGKPRPRTGASIRADIAEGLAHVTRTRRIMIIFGLLLSVSLFVMNNNVVVPLLAHQVLRTEASGLGALMATLGVGALTGALALAVTGRQRPRLVTLMLLAAIAATAMLALGFVRHLPLAAAVLFVLGSASIMFTAGSNTTVQLSVPDHLRGRTMSLYTLVFVGATPFGSLLLGTVAEHWGASIAFTVSGASGLAMVLLIATWWRITRRR
jgi:MFS family permease